MEVPKSLEDFIKIIQLTPRAIISERDRERIAAVMSFDSRRVIEISEKGDEAMMAALDAGAEDVADEEEMTVIYTAASDLMKVRQALVDAGMTVTSAELQYVPNSYVPVEGENAEKLEKLLGAVDDLDDVVNTYTNAE